MFVTFSLIYIYIYDYITIKCKLYSNYNSNKDRRYELFNVYMFYLNMNTIELYDTKTRPSLVRLTGVSGEC